MSKDPSKLYIVKNEVSPPLSYINRFSVIHNILRVDGVGREPSSGRGVDVRAAVLYVATNGRRVRHRPKAFSVRFHTAETSASRLRSGGRHGSTPPQGT